MLIKKLRKLSQLGGIVAEQQLDFFAVDGSDIAHGRRSVLGTARNCTP
jgi:hypothetical protein